MATTTPNYGWTVPTSTDLVKDGATAIETLGDAVDATVFSNANAAINKTIVDAKGDLIAATAADTVARLAVGSNDQVLTADSTTATGLKWATVAGGGMTLLSTTTLSGASTTISSINGSYKNLVAFIYGFTNATSDGNLQIAPNGDTTLSNFINTANTSGAESYFSSDIIKLGTISTFSRTSTSNTAVIEFVEYANTSSRKLFTHNANPSGYPSSGFGFYNNSSAITSLVFSNSGGNFTAGTVLLYGVK